MQKLRNLPHIASMAFNEPLLLEPAYAQVFFCALAREMGISTVRGPDGSELGIGSELAGWNDDGDRDNAPRRSYQVVDGIAVVPVSGTLITKTASLQPYSGMTGYNGIVARLNQAMSDSAVDGILLDMDTPGGMVSGAFDCADMIARMREIKPIWALANDMNCSAGQLIASAANRRLVTQTARTGSIGVLMAHSNYANALKQQGVEITLIHSGDHKVDGNPYEKLKPEIRDRIQRQINATRQMFASKVAGYTSMSVADVLATEAAVYTGAEALEIGLADELVINSDAIAVMRSGIKSKQTITFGGAMPGEATTDAQAANAGAEDTTQTAATVVISQPASAALAPVSGPAAEVINAAVLAEQQRIMGIIGSEEASGRESLAKELANTPGMTVESAKRLMATVPLSAQARTETSLDTMMENSPKPAAPGPGAATDDDDLMCIPV